MTPCAAGSKSTDLPRSANEHPTNRQLSPLAWSGDLMDHWIELIYVVAPTRPRPCGSAA